MKNKYMLIYWWGYHRKDSKDDRPFIEWVDEKA